MRGHREPFRLDGPRIRLGAAEAELLRPYALRHSLSLSEAARLLIRTSLTRSASALIESDDTERGALLEELTLFTLIVAEQTLKLVETITPRGPGAGDQLLETATLSVQRRLAYGLSPGLAGPRNGQS
ncbi:MAG: hypothetical protein E6J01_06165 [Chloroflexi bacterium]|nr:MAG: hypothetical protein E6J01_06165 [Chloroflexota bacterium]